MPSQLHEVQGEVVKKLGYPHKFIYHDEKLPHDVEIVLVQGPYGSLVPLVQQLVDLPPDRRPVLAYWWQQSMELSLPEAIRRPLMNTFSDLFRRLTSRRPITMHLRRATNDIVASRGRRLGYMGDLIWLQEHGLLDVLALSSSVYQEYLARFGIDSILIPRGFHPAYGQALDLKRTIPAVWMGKLRTKRRRRGVEYVKRELARRGSELRVFDGVENAFIFDDHRTNILNQTCFVINVFFSGPTDELSIRYFIAAANGAVNITEPGFNEYPFIPGKHLVECPIDDMPDKIVELVRQPESLAEMSRNMLELMRGELTLSSSISKILDRAEEKIRVRG